MQSSKSLLFSLTVVINSHWTQCFCRKFCIVKIIYCEMKKCIFYTQIVFFILLYVYMSRRHHHIFQWTNAGLMLSRNNNTWESVSSTLAWEERHWTGFPSGLQSAHWTTVMLSGWITQLSHPRSMEQSNRFYFIPLFIFKQGCKNCDSFHVPVMRIFWAVEQHLGPVLASASAGWTAAGK